MKKSRKPGRNSPSAKTKRADVREVTSRVNVPRASKRPAETKQPETQPPRLVLASFPAPCRRLPPFAHHRPGQGDVLLERVPCAPTFERSSPVPSSYARGEQRCHVRAEARR